MFSSRNIHFAILGLILGAVSGYVFAFYQAHTRLPTTATTKQAPASGLPQDHPNVSNEQMVALFQEAIEKNPDNTELMIRYANFLFNINRLAEAVEWFRKVLELQPNNLDVRTDMATALWHMGKSEEAVAEYEKCLKADPRHMPTLHNLFLVEVNGNLKAAAELLQRMEQIDAKYESLPALRQKLEDARKTAAGAR
jgi:Flp pilus assembly protein TadD